MPATQAFALRNFWTIHLVGRNESGLQTLQGPQAVVSEYREKRWRCLMRSRML
jgi:hypothetical protein